MHTLVIFYSYSFWIRKSNYFPENVRNLCTYTRCCSQQNRRSIKRVMTYLSWALLEPRWMMMVKLSNNFNRKKIFCTGQLITWQHPKSFSHLDEIIDDQIEWRRLSETRQLLMMGQTVHPRMVLMEGVGLSSLDVQNWDYDLIWEQFGDPKFSFYMNNRS